MDRKLRPEDAAPPPAAVAVAGGGGAERARALMEQIDGALERVLSRDSRQFIQSNRQHVGQ